MKKTFILAALLFGIVLSMSSPVEARHHRRCHSNFGISFSSFAPAYYAQPGYYAAPAYYCPPPPPVYAGPPAYYYPAAYPAPVYVARPCYAQPAVGLSFGFNFR